MINISHDVEHLTKSTTWNPSKTYFWVSDLWSVVMPLYL